jgi:hypothetical protein
MLFYCLGHVAWNCKITVNDKLLKTWKAEVAAKFKQLFRLLHEVSGEFYKEPVRIPACNAEISNTTDQLVRDILSASLTSNVTDLQ